MGFLDWFSRKPAHSAAAGNSLAESSYLNDGHSGASAGGPKLQTFPGVLVRPSGGDSQPSSQPASQPSSFTAEQIKNASLAAVNRTQARRNQRNAYRELLHQIVRESMVRNGMLSASYKFKVLSLDPRGLSFLVMMDLPLEFGEQVTRLGEIERMIIHNAKVRHQLVVSAVYWRVAPVPVHEEQKALNAQAPVAAVLAGIAAPAASVAPAAPKPESAPVAPVALAPQRPVLAAVPVPAAPARSPVKTPEPVLEDEVQALKKALAAGAEAAPTSRPALGAAVSAAIGATVAAPGRAAAAPKDTSDALLLTGFEETEMRDPDEDYPQLGATQYGDIR